MKHLDAVNTSCRKSVRNAGLSPEEYFATKIGRGQTNTANNQWTEVLVNWFISTGNLFQYSKTQLTNKLINQLTYLFLFL
jgi:hypothetical protein